MECHAVPGGQQEYHKDDMKQSTRNKLAKRRSLLSLLAPVLNHLYVTDTRRAHWSYLLILLFSWICTTGANGQTNIWLGGTFWSTTANWSLGVVPTSDHDVVIPSGSGNVFLNVNGQCNSLRLESGTGDIQLVFTSSFNLAVTDSIIVHPGDTTVDQGDDRRIDIGPGTLTCAALLLQSTAYDEINSSVVISSGTLSVDGNLIMESPGPRNFLQISGTGTVNVSGNLSGGDFQPGSSTVNYNGGNSQSIEGYSFHNLVMSGGGDKTLLADVTTTGNITVDAGTNVSLGAYNLTIDANADRQLLIDGTIDIDGDGRLLELQGGIKTLTIGSGGMLKITDTGGSTLPVFDAYALDVNSTVEYGASDAQTIEDAVTYGNLILSGGNTKTLETMGGSVSISGDLEVGAGTTLASNDQAITLGGDWINEGSFSSGTSVVIFNSTTAQVIGGSAATAFAGLTINHAGPGVSLSGNTTVSSSLTLTDGEIITGTNTLNMSASAPGAISGGSASSFVRGNLQRAIASGANSYFFPVGTVTAYAPTTIDFKAGTTAGLLIAATYDGDHPNIGGSILYPQSSVNRYWIVAVQTGLTTTDYDATFQWVAGDEDASFDDLSSQVGKYTLTTWTYPNVLERTSNSIKVGDLSGFSDFQVSSCSNPVINQQPNSVNACESDMIQLSVEPENTGDLAYQWYKTGVGQVSNGGNISGATTTTLTFNPISLSDAGDYYAEISRECGAMLNSTEATITILDDVNYGVLASGDETVCPGGDPELINFSSVPSGGAGSYAYQWFYRNGLITCPTGSNTSGWTLIASATNNTYDPPAGLNASRTYAVQVDPTGSPDCGSVMWADGCRQVTVNLIDAGSMGFDQTVCEGGDPSAFSPIDLPSASGAISYQWQSSTADCISGFSDIPGATGAIFNPPSGAAQTTYYRREVSSLLNGLTCSAFTNCLTITLNEVDPGSISGDETICSGGDPALKITSISSSGSGTLTYQWQSSTTDCMSGFSDISGATNENYDPPSGLTLTTYYRRQTSSTLNSVVCTEASNCIAVVINDVNGGVVSSDQTVCSGGDPAELTTTSPATGSGALSYQWQSSTIDCMSGFSDISGATNESYDPPSGATVTTYYRREVASTLNTVICSSFSNCVIAYINDIDPGSINDEQVICSSGDGTLLTTNTAATGSGALTYQWQSSITDCVNGFSDIDGATNENYDPPSGAIVTTYYRRVVTSTLNGVPCSAPTNCVGVVVNDVDGGEISSDQTICVAGDPATITTTDPATGSGTLSYQWQSSTTDCSAGFIDISGATDETYDPPSGIAVETKYRRVATSILGGVECSALSNCATIIINSVDAGVVITDQTICTGGNPEAFTTSVAATGSGALTYQWQHSTVDCNTGFTDISGATNETYDPPSGLTQTTRYRRVVISTLNGIECISIGNCITVTVNLVDGGEVGSDHSVCSGGDPSLLSTINAASGLGTLSYQWQSSTADCGSSFADISGATNENFDPPSGLTLTTYYRRQTTSLFNGLECTAISNCITVVVNDVNPGTITSDQTICSGGDPEILTTAIAATGVGTLSYQWQSSTADCNSGFTDISGATNETYDPPANQLNTTYYRRWVTSTYTGVQCSAVSNCITITINQVTSGLIGTHQTICSGGNPGSLNTTASATGSGPLTYQWQSSVIDCVSGFADIPGATTENYDPPAGITQTTYFRRQVTSTLNGIMCDVYTNCLLVTVNDVNAGMISSEQTVCSGGDPLTIITQNAASGSGLLAYQWQSSTTDCNSGFTDIPGATNEIYNPPSGATETTYYRREITSTLNGVDCIDNSNCITIHINDIDPGSVLGDQTVCTGEDPGTLITDISATASGTITYQWQSSTTDCSSGFADISGATNETYDPPNGATVTTYYKRRAISTLNGISCEDISNCLIVELNEVSGGSAGMDQTVCPGGDPEILDNIVLATGSGPITYQWQQSTTDCVSDFTDISNATSSGYDPPLGLVETTHYRRVATSTLNGIFCLDISPCVTAEVNQINAGVIETDQTLCSGGNPAPLITQVAASATGTLTYQWQSSTTDCNAGFGDISGATDETYDPPSGATVTNHYRRRVTSDYNGVECEDYSNCTTIYVNDISGGAVDTDQTICSGGDPLVFNSTTSATGSGTISYQWQSSTTDCNTGFTDIPGATDATHDAGIGVTLTTYYRRIATSLLNGVPCSISSNCIVVTVNDVFAGTIDQEQTLCSGDDPSVLNTLSVATGTGIISYQWQSSITDCSTNFTDISGATDETYQPPAGATVTTYYRRLATSTLNSVQCTDISNCVSIFVNDISSGSISEDQTICSAGDPASLETVIPSSGSGNITYQWQSSTTDCNTEFTDISGATNEEYDPPANLTETTYYRRAVISTLNGAECSDISNCVTVAVLEDVNYGSLASADETFCPGGDPSLIEFAQLPTGATSMFTYQWYYQDGLQSCPGGGNTTGWSMISGATDIQYDPPPGLLGSRTYGVIVDIVGSPDCGAPLWADGCRQVMIYDTMIVSGTISGSPTVMICDAGNPGSFQAQAPSGGDESYSYQWEQSLSCTGSWEAAEAENGITNTLTFDPPQFDLPLSEVCYRLKITDGCGSVGYSDVKTFQILEDPVSPTINPIPAQGTTLCLGDVFSATFNPGSGGAGIISDIYEVSVNGGMLWQSYTPGEQIVVTAAMVGSNTLRVRSIRTASGIGCDDGMYNTVQWSVDYINPVIQQCPQSRIVEGCNLGDITSPSYSPSLNASDYITFANATNQGNASDACGITSVQYIDFTSGSCPTSINRTWIVADSAGNSVSCNQNIQLLTPAILIQCAPDSMPGTCHTEMEIANAFAIWINTLQNTISGGCNPDVIYRVGGAAVTLDTLSPPDYCSGGSISVTVDFTDQCDNGSTVCSSEFTVDPAPPIVINCPEDVTISDCQSQQTVDNAFDAWINSVSQTVSGGCAPGIEYRVGGSVVQLGDINSPDRCTGGAITVVVSYNDLCETGTAICTTQFEVIPVSVITFNGPPNTLVTGCTVQDSINTAFDQWTSQFNGSISGGCDPQVIYKVDNIEVIPETLVAPSQCSGESITVEVQYADSCEQGSYFRTFEVEETPLVSINCPTNIVLNSCTTQQDADNAFSIWINSLENAISGGCSPFVGYVVDGDTMTDLSSILPPGVCIRDTITVECYYSDLCESGTCSSTFITPLDNGPSFVDPPQNRVEPTTSGCISSVNIDKPATADDCDNAPSLTITSNEPGQIFTDQGNFWSADFELGITTVTIEVTDYCGNTASHQFTIEVVDQSPPVISGCVTDITQSGDADTCGTFINWAEPTAMDNCPGVSLSTSHPVGTFFPVGTTTVTYIAEDVPGLRDTCSFNITIEDITPPAINCDTILTINLPSGVPPGCINNTDIPIPTGVDNCDGPVLATGVRSDGMALTAPWTDGTTTTVTWTLTDAAGNTATCFQDVVIAECAWPSQYVYVDSSKTSGAQNGGDWENAVLTIDAALTLAGTYPEIQEIWVAKGTYFPTNPTNRNSAFIFPSGTHLRGGFAGVVEDSTDRDLDMNPTVLTGDIGTFGNNDDNCYHVVSIGTGDNSIIIDGFIIEKGNANGPNGVRRVGAGVYCRGQLELSNCTLRLNNSINSGAAVYIDDASSVLTIDGCKIMNNTSGLNHDIWYVPNATIIFEGDSQIDD